MGPARGESIVSGSPPGLHHLQPGGRVGAQEDELFEAAGLHAEGDEIVAAGEELHDSGVPAVEGNLASSRGTLAAMSQTLTIPLPPAVASRCPSGEKER